MSAPRVSAARTDAEALTAAGIPAYVDPAKAAANLPCVLFLPPVLRFSHLGGGHQTDWRLAILADAAPGLDAWEQLDDLLERLAPEVNLVTAEPGSYQLSGNKDPVPAYLCAVTE
jgi:hypothetical protein